MVRSCRCIYTLLLIEIHTHHKLYKLTLAVCASLLIICDRSVSFYCRTDKGRLVSRNGESSLTLSRLRTTCHILLSYSSHAASSFCDNHIHLMQPLHFVTNVEQTIGMCRHQSQLTGPTQAKPRRYASRRKSTDWLQPVTRSTPTLLNTTITSLSTGGTRVYFSLSPSIYRKMN